MEAVRGPPEILYRLRSLNTRKRRSAPSAMRAV